jgi:DNA-binding MarR family transcriptional regulator
MAEDRSQDRVQEIARELMESYICSRTSRSLLMNPAPSWSPKPGEAMVLYWINAYTESDERGPMVSEISERLNVTAPTVTQHLNSLEEQGLVERRADPSDRRIVRVRLTDAGKAMIGRIHEHRLRLFAGLVDHLGEEDSLRLARLMRKAAEYVNRQLGLTARQPDAEARGGWPDRDDRLPARDGRLPIRVDRSTEGGGRI